MTDRTWLDWPFFDDRHRSLERDVARWRDADLKIENDDDPHAACRSYVAQLGAAGWLRHAVPDSASDRRGIDVRAVCLIRETLGYVSGLAEFAFAMQGLGSGPIALFGSEALRRAYLPEVAAGKAIAAFAISEAGAGSDVAALQTTARSDGSGIVIDGEKT